jgi:DNA-binding NarL/FixJ family response regulator
MAKQISDQEMNISTRKPITVLLADDHKIIRAGLRELIEKEPGFKVIAEAGNGRQALRQCSKLSPDIVLMDISMPDLNGIEATRQLVKDVPKTKAIILSVHMGRTVIAEVFKAGASGYLLKNCSFKDMVSAINAVMAGEIYLSPEIASVVCEDYIRFLENDESIASSGLTPREREVLQLLSEGLNTKEIAFSFNLSVKTVEVHRQNIMKKLNIHNIAELTKYAIREGLTSEEY